MRSYAAAATVGQAHYIAAAVVMTAFSVEAFVQTLGPQVYGEDWTRHPRPAERLPVKVKLKCIGKHFGRPVSYGADPWRDLARLMEARDRAAHPRPEEVPVREVVDAEDATVALDQARTSAFIRANPMHDIGALDTAANSIEAGLIEIWVASGGTRHVLKGWRQGVWGVSLA